MKQPNLYVTPQRVRRTTLLTTTLRNGAKLRFTQAVYRNIPKSKTVNEWDVGETALPSVKDQNLGDNERDV